MGRILKSIMVAQEYIFRLGSFSALSRSEICGVFPGFSGSFLASSNILQGKFDVCCDPFSQDEAKQNIQKRFDELGGSVRFGEVLAKNESLKAIEQCIADEIERKYDQFQKKICFGISVFLKTKNDQRMRKTLLVGVKKECQKRRVSMRFVNRNFQNLDAGTYWKEGLSKEENMEFCIWKKGEQFLCSKVLAVQNVESFATRDYEKPVRDMQVGMLPPKLALMMVNLSRNKEGELPNRIWDPFCGTGTVLVEAKRMGVECLGSDLNPKMVSASRRNLRHFFAEFDEESVIRHDVTKSFSHSIGEHTIVTEGYLGDICRQPVSESEFYDLQRKIAPVYEGFFENLPRQKVEKIILSFPFWKRKNGGYWYLQKLLEKAHSFGYTVRDFSEGTKRGGLEFMRNNQVVGREIFCFLRS